MSPLAIVLLRMAGADLIGKWFSKGKEERAMTGTKAWWKSRAVWGGLVSAIAGIGGLFGFSLDEATQGGITRVLQKAIHGLLQLEIRKTRFSYFSGFQSLMRSKPASTSCAGNR